MWSGSQRQTLKHKDIPAKKGKPITRFFMIVIISQLLAKAISLDERLILYQICFVVSVFQPNLSHLQQVRLQTPE